MNKRLLQFLQSQDITQSQFADSLGVARGSISHILAGRNRPGYDFLENLALRYPSLNMDWLLTGRGKMTKAAAPEDGTLPFLPQEARKEISHITVFFTDNTFKTFSASE